ncbi:hypothetical protein [[Mycobacterium] zoologicum]|uniref:hypothetical protein n=1 Tax=[Mycobacterium] zoologicum TaxID=2872311 RepID=UPI001CDAFC17|nr:hypothetical protein [Mycolicibacter sp. MYC101]MEB3062383.1 hypothetical protein [Mycolicibacter sp. MYC101]
MSVGSGRVVVAALATLGCCLLTAPAASADFEDLFDPFFGVASAGPDLGDAGAVDVPEVADVNSVLNDPLAQLDQLFHSSPAPSGADEQASARADSHDDTTGSGHSNSDDSNNSSSNNSSSLPKFSMPSGGNGGGGSGGGGNGGGGNGGGGNPGNGGAKTKSNTSRHGPAPEGAAPGEAPALP